MIPDALLVNCAIRLSPADSIGVPVFRSGNAMYLPEMDADLNISSFLFFDNSDCYEITDNVPDTYRARLFHIGDPAPIIFWLNQTAHIVEGDIEASRLEELFGLQARVHPVLRDLGGMIRDARNGVFKQRREEWLAQEIEASYSDVFLEEPSRTRYWVSRYRVALENARKLTQPPHPIDVRLRRASSKWMELFATKAEFKMLASILGEASQGVYSIKQITDIMFAYMSHRLPSANSQEVARWVEDSTISSLFGRGLYDMYLFDGWPHVPFEYSKPDLLGILKERIVQGQERKSWRNARLVSSIVLGEKDAPAEIDDIAMVYIRDVLSDYSGVVSQAQFEYGANPLSNGLLPFEIARTIVSLHEQATDLSCIMHGQDRVAGSVQQRRFGLEEANIDAYRDYLKEWRET